MATSGSLPWNRWTGRIGVRTRVLAAVSLLSLLSLILAGVVAFSLERQRIDEGIDQALERRQQEFVALGNRNVDPSTGRPFQSLRDLLRVTLQNTIPHPNEGELGIIGGRVVWKAPAGVPLRLEDDPELVHVLIHASEGERVVRDMVRTRRTAYRYIVIPATVVQTDPAKGAFVLAYDLRAEHRQLLRTYGIYALVCLGTLALVGLTAWLIIGRLLEPIKWVRQTAQEITDTDLSRRIPVRGHDDLADLTVTVNAMLDRLETTFADQRQLYDDVGHELRTPLTVVRGHLELVDADDPNDVRATRQLCLSEFNRMGRLVEDLITLAKAGRPDFVTCESVDVAVLTDETLVKASGLGQRRWVLDQVAGITAQLDPQRIAQALLELSRNAVKFSQVDSVIALGSAADGQYVRLWVRDEGTGIPADKIDEVRKRFVRNVSKTTEGSGLGLAIVSSIAEAHHGQLDIQSQPGQGSTISLVLPLRQEHPDEPDPDR